MTARSIADQLPDYVLGTLPDDQHREIERLVADSPELRREVDAITEALAGAAASALAPLPPPPRDRLLATLASVDRFAPFMDDLTRLFELPADVLRGLLARADDAATRWETSLAGVALDGTELFHFRVGPRLAAGGAAGGVLRVRAGALFPVHSHGGDEVTYVLEGSVHTAGRAYGPGSEIAMKGGTSHTFNAGPERSLLIIVLHGGITF